MIVNIEQVKMHKVHLLNEADFALWEQFKVHHAKFKIIFDAGILTPFTGSATIHSDSDGNFRKIEMSHVRFVK